MTHIECIIYESGSSIFNYADKPNKKYRVDVNIISQININQQDIYENKKVDRRIKYLYTKNNRTQPMINIFFASDASLNRFIKLNKKTNFVL